MLWGVNKQDVFFEDKDYLEFQNIIQKTRKFIYIIFISIIFLCFNAKSYSFRIKDENKELSQIIHSIATSYAIYFNRK